MNDGAYIYKWFPAVTDKEDKRGCRFNRTKGEPLIVKDWEYPIYRGDDVALYINASLWIWAKIKASEALPRMPTTKRSMLNDYSES